MKRLYSLLWDRRGASAIEFAIAAPLLVTVVFGVMETGMLYNASTGLKHGANEAARIAALYPRPTDEAIAARFANQRFGVEPKRSSLTIVRGTTADKVDYVDLTARADVSVSLIFTSIGPIKLVQRRRVFLA